MGPHLPVIKLWVSFCRIDVLACWASLTIHSLTRPTPLPRTGGHVATHGIDMTQPYLCASTWHAAIDSLSLPAAGKFGKLQNWRNIDRHLPSPAAVAVKPADPRERESPSALSVSWSYPPGFLVGLPSLRSSREFFFSAPLTLIFGPKCFWQKTWSPLVGWRCCCVYKFGQTRKAIGPSGTDTAAYWPETAQLSEAKVVFAWLEKTNRSIICLIGDSCSPSHHVSVIDLYFYFVFKQDLLFFRERPFLSIFYLHIIKLQD